MSLLWQGPTPPLCMHLQWGFYDGPGLGLCTPLVVGPHFSPFRLFLHRQLQFFPRVCPLKPKFQYPLPAHTSRHESWAEECREVARSLCAGLSLFSLFCLPQSSCCALLWAREALFLSQLISQLVKGVPRVKEPFLFHSSLPWAQAPSRFLSFFSFILPSLWWSFLQFWLYEISCQHLVGLLWELFHM